MFHHTNPVRSGISDWEGAPGRASSPIHVQIPSCEGNPERATLARVLTVSPTIYLKRVPMTPVEEECLTYTSMAYIELTPQGAKQDDQGQTS